MFWHVSEIRAYRSTYASPRRTSFKRVLLLFLGTSRRYVPTAVRTHLRGVHLSNVRFSPFLGTSRRYVPTVVRTHLRGVHLSDVRFSPFLGTSRRYVPTAVRTHLRGVHLSNVRFSPFFGTSRRYVPTASVTVHAAVGPGRRTGPSAWKAQYQCPDCASTLEMHNSIDLPCAWCRRAAGTYSFR